MNNHPKRFKPGWLDWTLLGAIGLLVAILFLPRPDAGRGSGAEGRGSGAVSPAGSEERGAGGLPGTERPPGEWGIEVVGLYPAVGGRVLDLRYKIVDATKAASLPNETGPIYLVDEASGRTTHLPNSPKTGSIPQNPQKLENGRTYSLSFPSQGERFKSGSKLSLVIGAFRADNLTVQ